MELCHVFAGMNGNLVIRCIFNIRHRYNHSLDLFDQGIGRKTWHRSYYGRFSSH
jgi:hypothetical protein